MRIQVDSTWMFNEQILIWTVYRFLSLRRPESSARKFVHGANPLPTQRAGSHTLRDDPLRSFRSFFRRIRLESFKIETSTKSKNCWKRIRQINRWERLNCFDCLVVSFEIRASHLLKLWKFESFYLKGWESKLEMPFDWKHQATIAQQGKTKERTWTSMFGDSHYAVYSSLVTFSMARQVCYIN